MPSDGSFSDNQKLSRFELHENGHLAYAAYKKADGILIIPYVESAPALRGTGAAGRLMTAVAAAARRENLKVRPLCSYAAAWFRKHAEQHDLLAD